MIKKVLLSTLCILVLSTSCGRRLPSIDNNNQQTTSDIKEVIIKRKPSEIASVSSTSKLLTSATKVKTVKKLGFDVVKVPSGMDINTFINELSKDPTVEYAEPNFVRKTSVFIDDLTDNSNTQDQVKNLAVNKNQPFYNTKLSGLVNDPDVKQQYALDILEADKAWKITEGSANITIAVIDTGADLHHPDLVDNLVKGYTTVNGTDSPNDDNGHGTHVAGIISAISNNQKGGAGLAPKCKVMPIKVLSAKGEGDDSEIAEGITWAVDHGANIISLSLGGPEPGKTLENSMKYAYNSNVLVIAAMGNNGKNVKDYPAAYKNVIAVGATDSKNKVTSFSNYGEWISVVAPGYKIYSTFPTYRVEMSKYNLPPNYAILSGTSMATPFVAGLAGLIMSKYPGISRADVRKKIETTANDIGDKGVDIFSGTGVIDAYKALL